MKDSSGDWSNTKTFLDAFAQDGFDVFVGSESFLLANMRNGGAGTISATANVNAAAIHNLYSVAPKTFGAVSASAVASAVSADPHLEHQQSKLNAVREVFARKSWPSIIAAVKQAMAIYHNDLEWTRLRPPLVGLTAEQANLLATELKRIGFAMPGIEA
jgi:4-hydroxy-tetrahydrodipicolinate synthase